MAVRNSKGLSDVNDHVKVYQKWSRKVYQLWPKNLGRNLLSLLELFKPVAIAFDVNDLAVV